jgi:hypothetical protein
MNDNSHPQADDVQGLLRAATSHDFQLAARLDLTQPGILVPSPSLLGSKPSIIKVQD